MVGFCFQPHRKISLDDFSPKPDNLQTNYYSAGYLSKAVLQTSNDISPEEMIKDIFIGGGCFEATNITYQGKKVSRGTFSQGEGAIDMESGIMLSTDNIRLANGPNNKPDAGRDFLYNNPPGDIDLARLIPQQNTIITDVTILEFDFIPTTDNISFQYLFASEEYCEYVNDEFNDVFGFFVSDPGINGSFSNNAENIALIPGSSDNVSINTVNYSTYSNFYQNNVYQGPFYDLFFDGEGCKSGELNGTPVAPNEIQYDGFTKVLTARSAVIPCNTYYIKLVIGDVGDGELDSAVFLKANSFNSGNLAELSIETPTSG